MHDRLRGEKSEIIEIAKCLATLPAEKRRIFRKAMQGKGIDWRELPIVRRPRMSDRHPLSFAQQRLWFLEQLEQGKPIYNLFSGLCFLGKLDIEVLERSINEIVRRHEILRTHFINVNGEGCQVVQEFQPYRLHVTDLRGHDPSFQKALLSEIASIDALAPFDLSCAPLFRIRVVWCGEADHVVMFTAHHIIFDAWSEGLMAAELKDLYTAFVQGLPSPLPELPIQYVDFACWQQEWMESGDFEVQRRYWEAQLRDAPALLALPLDHPHPTQRCFQGRTETLVLPESLAQNLYFLCRKQDVTLYMLMLAAFNVLLERYSGQEDISVGTSIANRPRPETEKLIGFLVNTLVMRNNLAGDPMFLEFLQRVKEVTSAAYAHQDMPFEKLVDLPGVDRGLTHTPLFQIFFVLENVPDRGGLSLPDVALEPFEFDVGLARFDLTLRIGETKGRRVLHCRLQYNTGLFDRSTVVCMLGHYRSLLEGIVAWPRAHLSELSLLTEEERHQIVVAWNTTYEGHPGDLCVHQLFEAAVHQHPDAVAVVYEDQRLSYGELNARANRLAHDLRGRGVGPGVQVGLCVERSIEMVVGILGVLKAGGTYMPLDPTFPKERLAFMLEDAEVSVLLTQQRLLEELPGCNVSVICLDRDWTAISTPQGDFPAPDPQNLAYLIYTSGSTGVPKGVMVAHRQVVNYAHGVLERLALPEEASFALVSTVAADLGNTALFGALCSGRTLHILSTERGFHPDGMAEYVHRYQIDVLKITPSHLVGLLEAAHPEQVLPKRCLVLGGEAASWTLIDRIYALVLHCTVINHYGPTETTVGVLTHRLDPKADRQGATVPIGRPLANSRVYLLDRRLEPVPIGIPGELYIGGVGVARGYHHRPDLTAERFIPDPFCKQGGGRLYRTGDRARYLADGTMEFLGRRDDQVKIRGFRIELGEIEAQLRSQPEIRDAVVVVRDGPAEVKQLVAYMVVATDAALDVAVTRQRLAQRLPEYMVPHVIIVVEALPLTANGKVDRKALPAPEEVAGAGARCDEAPRNETEETLAAIWAEVLQREWVGIHDNFFELGGDSILSLQIIARAHRQGIKLTPKQMFEHPTVARIATVATTVGREEFDPPQGVVTGTVPLTPIQRWYFEAQHPNPHHWNQAVLLEVKQPLEMALLKQAVQHLVSHHDALRMRFKQGVEGTWQQSYAETETHPLCLRVDLSQAAREDQVALEEALEAMASDIQRSLHIIHGPLLKVAYFALGVEEPDRLLIVVHHLVVDGVSWRVLLGDLQTAYRQLEQGQPVSLSAKTTSVKVWAERLCAYAESEEVRSELDYWLAEGKKAAASLPIDPSGGENRVGSAKTISVALSPEETRALLQDVPPVYRTQVNDILLTALAQTLCRWTGHPSVLVELEGHGREDLFEGLDLSRTMGWFTTRFPVCLTLSDAGPGEAIQAVKEQLRRAPKNGIGYGLLRYLTKDPGVRMALTALPSPQVTFNYLGQLDLVLDRASLFTLAKESTGLSRDPNSKRLHLLDVNIQVADRRLCIDWTYPSAEKSAAVIEALAHHYVDALQNLIAHCSTPEAGGVAPSDFPEAGLTDAELSDLLKEIG